MKKAVFVILISLNVFYILAQNDHEKVIFSAMQDELQRSVKELVIEGLQKPCYISYRISDAQYLYVSSSLGALNISESKPLMSFNIRLMVGGYKRNNENYYDMNNVWGEYLSGSLPVDYDYNQIRRALWISTDKLYKCNAEIYEGKMSAMQQQNISEEIASLYDFSEAAPLEKIITKEKASYDKAKWEQAAVKLSALFNEYPQIHKSTVCVHFYHGDIYYVNSEGTRTKKPLQLAVVLVNASSQADDGERIIDHLVYVSVTPDELPAAEEMEQDVRNMAQQIIALKEAPVMEESYIGPVMFEEQAVGELFAQKYFLDYSGLISNRRPIVSKPNVTNYIEAENKKSLERRLGRKMLPAYMSVMAVPTLEKMNGNKLAGSYSFDAEGVIPDDTLFLVKDGFLRTLLSDRTPTKKISASNGHKRLLLGREGILKPQKCPGVIQITAKKTKPYNALKQQLIEMAKDEGLDHAYIIRKMASDNCNLPKYERKNVKYLPIYIYRVDVATGKETLVRSAKIKNISFSTLKRIKGVSSTEIVHNRLMPYKGRLSYYYNIDNSWRLWGAASTFIVPEHILVEEMEIEKEEWTVTPKLPVVGNPVE